LVQDSVAATILSTAADMRADLITVGTHGQSGIERLMLGSVAAKVLGAAQVDVLAVPAVSRRQ
jgi:nucleotide-binding universal stress UspA family protein